MGFCLLWVSHSCAPERLLELLPLRACGPLPPAEPSAVLGWLESCTAMPEDNTQASGVSTGSAGRTDRLLCH